MSETEMQNWVVANESMTLQEFWYNMRYEPHPFLWHTLLFFISKIYPHYLAAQLLHLVINGMAIFFLFKYSPFPKIYNWIFAFGYFPFFEYNLITRNYALCFLFIILFVISFKYRYSHYLGLFVVAGLLANTHMYGLVISLSCVLLTIIDHHIEKRNLSRLQRRQFLVGSCCYLAIVIATVYYTRLPDDSILSIDLSRLFSLGRIGEAILGIWKSMVPVPRFFDNGFWNTNFFSSISPPFFVFLSAVLYTFLLTVFYKKPLALGLFLLNSLSLIFLFFLSKTTEMRHFGFFFLSFLISLWIASFYAESTFLTWSRLSYYIERYIKRLNKPLLILLLLTQLIAGVLFYICDLVTPFSQDKNVVQYLTDEGLSNELIAVDRYHIIPSITGYLSKSVYSLPTGKKEKFLVWNNTKAKILNETELLNAVAHASRTNKEKMVIILNYTLQTSEDILIPHSNLSIHLLHKFEGSLCPYENFYVYTLREQ